MGHIYINVNCVWLITKKQKIGRTAYFSLSEKKSRDQFEYLQCNVIPIMKQITMIIFCFHTKLKNNSNFIINIFIYCEWK